jgi:hypothetical protein
MVAPFRIAGCGREVPLRHPEAHPLGASIGETVSGCQGGAYRTADLP